MKWASSVSVGSDIELVVSQAAEAIKRQLGSEEADLVMVFVSPQFAAQYDRLPGLIDKHLPHQFMMGCSAGGVIGGGKEVEEGAAVSMTAALLPGVKVAHYYSDMEDLPDGDAAPAAWKAWLPIRQDALQHFIILADPFSVTVEPLLRGLDYAFPQSVKIGGVASGATAPGENSLFVNGQIYHKGVLIIGLGGDISVDTIVSQGCRPIGEAVPITACQQNVLLEVDGQAPMEYLQTLLDGLSDYDRELMRTSLFLGIEMDPLKEELEKGDFLVRNILGVDQESGAIAVGSLLHDGMMVQFHLRDRVTSTEDLQLMLERYKGSENAVDASGALLFSCLGRGRYLYGCPNHDSDLFRTALGSIPLGGFFCNGEIGPVGASTYVHGYTSSFGIFRPAASVVEGQ